MFGDQSREDANEVAMELDNSAVRDVLRDVVTEQLGYKRAVRTVTHHARHTLIESQ